MSRCPMTEASKYAYKAKPKQCLFPSEIKTVVPVSDFQKTGEFLTEIKFVWICMKHYKLLHAHKQDAIKNWIASEAQTAASLNGSAKT